MATVNQKLAEAGLSHSIDLQQYTNGVVYKMIALLNSVDADLMGQLTASLERMPEGSFNAKRLDALLVSVRDINREAYDAIQRELTPELRALTAYEAAYQYELFQTTIPQAVTAQIAVGAVNVEKAYTAAMSRPFQGRLLTEWMSDLEESRAKRIRDAVRMGYVESQTIPQIVRRIKGTRANKYADGIIQIDRRNAEAVVRTAIGHMAAETHNRFLEKNDDLINGVIWDATLDTRTTVHICVPRDGKKYTNITFKPIGHSLPWLGGAGRAHWNCRSSAVPSIKTLKELGIDLPDINATSTRASMDGQVSADITYGQWIQNQSPARQNEVLGVKRAKLMRDGGLTMDKFTNDKGIWINLDELKQRNARAFAKAGL